VSISKVSCGGNETVLAACQLERGQQCVIGRDAVAVRCYRNWMSQCQPGEINHNKKCYNLVIPNVHHALEGFSHGESLRDCQSRGSQLLDIVSQVRGYVVCQLNWTVVRSNKLRLKYSGLWCYVVWHIFWMNLYLHLHKSLLKFEAAGSLETMICIKTSLHHIPKDCNLIVNWYISHHYKLIKIFPYKHFCCFNKLHHFWRDVNET